MHAHRRVHRFVHTHIYTPACTRFLHVTINALFLPFLGWGGGGGGFQFVSRANNFLAHLPIFHNLMHLEVYVEPSADPGEYTKEILMDLLQKTPNLESLDIPEVDF